MSDEAGAWQWFKNGLGDRGHLVRIENVLEEGTPDVNYSMSEQDGWIEFKYVQDLPKRESTPVMGSSHKLQPAQIEWLVHRAKCGGRAFILLRSHLRVWLVPAHRAPEFNAASIAIMTAISVYTHNGPMRTTDWDRLHDILTRKVPDDSNHY